jgi:hypothetical protein
MTLGGRFAAAALLCFIVGVANAEDDAEHRLRDAQQRAAAGDLTAIDALEALGTARPVTRWTDDAWRSAAQLAERSRDYARARRDLEQVIATSDDDQVVRRARSDLERIAGIVGGEGEWAQVAAVHEQLAHRMQQGGDPTPLLHELEALIRANPAYPRAAMAMLVIARGWELEGDADRAMRWLREATAAAPTATERTRAIADLARTQIRIGELADARETIAKVESGALAGQLRKLLLRAELRRAIGWGVRGVLAILAAAAALGLRRAAGGWRRVPRWLLTPPTEAVFFAPIAALFVAVSQSGNPLVGRAVVVIAIAGTVVAWISGRILDGSRELRLRGTIAHAMLAVIAVACAVYLAVDHDRMIDLLIETWRGGHAH